MADEEESSAQTPPEVEAPPSAAAPEPAVTETPEEVIAPASVAEPAEQGSEATVPSEAVAPAPEESTAPTGSDAGSGAVEPPAPSTAPVSSLSVSAPNIIQTLLVKANATLRSCKQAKLDKVLTFAIAKKKISNDEVQALLRVSDKTATRYLDQLLAEGKLKRTGPREHTVYVLP